FTAQQRSRTNRQAPWLDQAAFEAALKHLAAGQKHLAAGRSAAAAAHVQCCQGGGAAALLGCQGGAGGGQGWVKRQHSLDSCSNDVPIGLAVMEGSPAPAAARVGGQWEPQHLLPPAAADDPVAGWWAELQSRTACRAACGPACRAAGWAAAEH
ncbi:hypothetical protein HaLaN_02532, partial [Haematococcus lacustris]